MVGIGGHVGGQVGARRKRGWVRIVLGILGILFVAVPMLVAALVIVIGVGRWESLDPEAQGRVPGQVTFDAEDGTTYVVALGTGIINETGGGRSFNTDVARDVRCTIRHPDDSEDTIRGDRQTSAVTRSGQYASVGQFEGRGGTTVLDCFATSTDVFGEERDLPMIVHGSNQTLQYVGYGLLIGSAVVVLGCAGLIVFGARGRAV